MRATGDDLGYSAVWRTQILIRFSDTDMIGATVDYTIYNFVISGAYEDYQIQMAEWLDILNDPEISDAELPAMNSEQGPFMLMVPTDEASDFTSSVYAEYYGKNSVIMVERIRRP